MKTQRHLGAELVAMYVNQGFRYQVQDDIQDILDNYPRDLWDHILDAFDIEAYLEGWPADADIVDVSDEEREDAVHYVRARLADIVRGQLGVFYGFEE